MTPKLILNASRRLKLNNDFVRTRKNGRVFRCPYFALFSTIRPEDGPRFTSARIGISASKRVGNAVARNRLKRRYRELFRTHQYEIRPGSDIVLSIRYPSNKASLDDLERRFMQAIRYNGLLRTDSSTDS